MAYALVSSCERTRRSRFQPLEEDIQLTSKVVKGKQMSSECLLTKVVVTDLDVVEGGLGLVIFDKVMLNAGFV